MSVSHIDVHVGNKLRDAREQRGIAIADLALQLGIPSENLSRIEDGSLRASAFVLFDLTTLLRMTTSDLYAGLNGFSGTTP